MLNNVTFLVDNRIKCEVKVLNLVNTYCLVKYYNIFDSTELLDQIRQKSGTNIADLSKEFQFIFHKMLYTDPCSYWNKDIFAQTLAQLESLFQTYGSMLEIDETVFSYFLMGYNSYCQISDVVLDLRNFNLMQETKTRLYRLPIYTALLESCLSNFLRVIAILIGKGIGKDYSSQNTLGQLNTVMSSNGYLEISNGVNVNIRNAINHGKVLLKKSPEDRICFYYSENHIPKCQEMSLYEFDGLIDDTYDLVSAVLLSLSVFMNNHITLLKIDASQKTYEAFAYLSMRLSLPGIYCQNISDTGNSKQLNIEILIDNTDRGFILQVATMLAIIVYGQYNDYDQYMFSFRNVRMLSGWIRYKNQEILDMSNKVKSFDEVLQKVIDRKDANIFPPSNEPIDLNEIKYFCFPNYNDESFKINNVADASLEDYKRLKAHLYIGDITEKQDIIDVINRAIEWLKTLRNPPSAAVPVKHGDIEADALYINVYRHDTRKSKELFPNNENFVCFVDWNLAGNTTLKNGGLPPVIWRQLSHEKIGKMHIAWREKMYCIRKIQKPERNRPCPCGSGKKFKKCCYGKGIYV